MVCLIVITKNLKHDLVIEDYKKRIYVFLSNGKNSTILSYYYLLGFRKSLRTIFPDLGNRLFTLIRTIFTVRQEPTRKKNVQDLIIFSIEDFKSSVSNAAILTNWAIINLNPC